MNVILIGYRGTGKTSVGQKLAARFQRRFVDADECLEARAGRSISEIFATQGEPAFRDLESQVVSEILAGDELVVSLGGGAVLRAPNRQAMARSGTTFWLRASAGTIAERLRNDPLTARRRPALTSSGGDKEIVDLLEERRPLYEQCADHTICTDHKSLDTIVDEIVCLLEHPRRASS